MYRCSSKQESLGRLGSPGLVGLDDEHERFLDQLAAGLECRVGIAIADGPINPFVGLVVGKRALHLVSQANRKTQRRFDDGRELVKEPVVTDLEDGRVKR